ncbi:MAG: hypothetical protein IKH22_07000 [Prevotella sp.]|nr:hypothetical protein [Prevotella sp.]
MTPLLTIIVSLLGCFCFYQWEKNRKDAEEVKLLMERTERLEAEKKQKADIEKSIEQGKTHQLVLYALDKLGCRYEEGEGDRIRTVYQGETFLIDANDDCLFINVLDPWWYELPMDGHIEDFARMQKAINRVNSYCGVTILYTINNEEKVFGAHTMKNLVFIPQIPHIDRYLESVFIDCFKAKRDVLAEIEKCKAAETATPPQA